MSTISEKLTQLNTIKGDIKTAINNKGGEVSDDFSTYATAINNLSTGSGGSSGDNSAWPEFYEFRTRDGRDFSGLFAKYFMINPSSMYKENMEKIENLDTSNVIDMQYAFYGFDFYYNDLERTNIDLSKWDVSKVEDTTYMFYSTSFRNINISGWNMIENKNMSYMFYNNAYLGNIDMSNVYAPKAKNLSYMCAYNSQVEVINMTGFSADNAENMQYAFYNDYEITSLDFSSFNTSKVTNMNSLFASCINLTTVTGYLDLSNLSNGFYPSQYSNPVKDCSKLETLYLKNIYKDITITNASKYSINLSPTVIKDSCLLYIIDQLPNLYEKGITNNTNIVLTLPPTNTLTQEQVQPAIDRGWQVANVNY